MKCPNCKSKNIYVIEKTKEVKGKKGIKFNSPMIIGYTCKRCKYYWNKRKTGWFVSLFKSKRIRSGIPGK